MVSVWDLVFAFKFGYRKRGILEHNRGFLALGVRVSWRVKVLYKPMHTKANPSPYLPGALFHKPKEQIL